MTDWRAYGADELPVPLAAALSAFIEHGYHGTSVREIAARAGLSVPGLYHHFPSKQAMLQALFSRSMEDLIGRMEAAAAEAGDDPVVRFDAVIESLLRFHMCRRGYAFVGSSELRGLEPEARREVVALRNRVQSLIDEVVLAGVASGDFGTPYPDDAARALATMCVGVSNWYRADGPLSPDELVARNLCLARSLVGYVQR